MLSFWHLNGFEDALDAWILRDSPSLDLRFLVTEWVVGRAEDPYIGVSRRLEIAPNYWFGVIPGSWEDDRVVTCGLLDRRANAVGPLRHHRVAAPSGRVASDSTFVVKAIPQAPLIRSQRDLGLAARERR